MICVLVCGSTPTGSSVSSEINNSLLSEVIVNQVKNVEVMRNMSKKPILQPKESKPLIATYILKKGAQVCVMARLGVEFVVKENKVELTKVLAIFLFICTLWWRHSWSSHTLRDVKNIHTHTHMYISLYNLESCTFPCFWLGTIKKTIPSTL